MADLKLSGESASLPIKLDPTILADSAERGKAGNGENDAFGRFRGKAGNGGFGDLALKGNRPFAGKSEIAEGRSDLRESVIRNDLRVGVRPVSVRLLEPTPRVPGPPADWLQTIVFMAR